MRVEDKHYTLKQLQEERTEETGETGEKNFKYKIQFSNISCFRPASLNNVPQNQS